MFSKFETGTRCCLVTVGP